MTVILDASALLSYLRQEPGAEVVDGVLGDSVMASENWAEVVQKSISVGVDVQRMLEDLQALGMKVEPFLPEDGDMAGRLWAPTRRLGLTVLTCYRAWAQLPLDVVIQLLH